MGGGGERDADAKKRGLSSPCFLLGSLQDSPPGEKPALKRRLFRTSPASRMFARVCVYVCV